MDIVFGAPLGNVTLGDEILRLAKEAAHLFHAQQIEAHYSDEPVENLGIQDFPIPEFHGLRELGYQLTGNHHWLATTGVDFHTDDAWGPTLAIVLYNDGFYFESYENSPTKRWGTVPKVRSQFSLKPGEWFIFDDYVDHCVETVGGCVGASATAYVVWTFQLREI